MAARGSKKAMKLKAEPLGDSSPLARKHTPPQGKGKVAVKATKGKEKEVIGTSGHAPMPGRQPRQVKSRYARSQVLQQGQPQELRQQLKRTRKDKQLLEEREGQELLHRIQKNPPKLALGMDEVEYNAGYDGYVMSSQEPEVPPRGEDAEATESEEEKSEVIASPLRSPETPADNPSPEQLRIAMPTTRRRMAKSPQPLSVASQEGDDTNPGHYLLRGE